MKTNSAITLFATTDLLLLIITTYHDYNITTVVQFTWMHVTYVLFYNHAGKKKKKNKKKIRRIAFS